MKWGLAGWPDPFPRFTGRATVHRQEIAAVCGELQVSRISIVVGQARFAQDPSMRQASHADPFSRRDNDAPEPFA
jgi:hypothetical protein